MNGDSSGIESLVQNFSTQDFKLEIVLVHL